MNNIGSKELFEISTQKTKNAENQLKELTSLLLARGYLWYKDFYVDWTAEPLTLKIYNNSIIQHVKKFIVKSNIGNTELWKFLKH